MEIIQGRSVAYGITGGHGSLTLCFSHLNPNHSIVGKKVFLATVSRWLDPVHSTVIVGGIANICALGEDRQHIDPSLDRTPSGLLATEFGRLFYRCAELAQEHTHATGRAACRRQSCSILHRLQGWSCNQQT
eukprot:2840819-Pyramimonas_sp.AAC.1